MEVNSNYIQIEEDKYEEEKRLRRQKRIEEMKKEKRKQELLRKYSLVAAIGGIACIAIISVIFSKVHDNSRKTIEQAEELQSEENIVSVNQEERQISSTPWEYEYTEPETQEYMEETKTVFAPTEAGTVNGFSDEIISEYGIFIDVENEKVLAKKNAYAKMYPASMTKILTVLVAAEQIEDLNDTFTMTIDITDYSYRNDCSSVGFEVGEEIPLIDLFYGTILPSGADAALGLAYYVAGSQDAFVELMNKKVEELGLSDTTHFTNCVGIYNQDHYSTAYDMAIILKAATDNELCREVMSAHTYTTSATEQHPEGITISNWFLRRIEDKDTQGEILCGKTGYVTQSGNCAASLGVDKNGNKYICVTAKSSSVWKCITDQAILYAKYLSE